MQVVSIGRFCGINGRNCGISRPEGSAPWVFHRDGRPIPKKRFYHVWHDACARAEVVNAIPHDLRRAAVMRFERDGVPRKVAMSITGHKTESIYGHYNIVREIEQREGLAKVTPLPMF